MRASVRSRVRGPDQCHEGRDEGEADGDQHRTDPVRARNDGDDRHRHDHGEEQLREVPCEIAVERVDARRQQRTEPTRLRSLQPGRPERGDVFGGGPPQFGLGRRRRPVRRAFAAPGQERSSGDHSQQCEQRTAERAQRLVVQECSGHDARDQPGLGDQQQGGQPAECNGEDEETPCRARVTEQPWVQGPSASASSCATGTVPIAGLRPCLHRYPPPAGRSRDAKPRLHPVPQVCRHRGERSRGPRS